MDALNVKLVEFDKFCHKCIHSDKSVLEEPCCDCIAIPARQYSHQPEYYKERENEKRTEQNIG